jgi:hypothetical protein
MATFEDRPAVQLICETASVCDARIATLERPPRNTLRQLAAWTTRPADVEAGHTQSQKHVCQLRTQHLTGLGSAEIQPAATRAKTETRDPASTAPIGRNVRHRTNGRPRCPGQGRDVRQRWAKRRQRLYKTTELSFGSVEDAERTAWIIKPLAPTTLRGGRMSGSGLRPTR